jgi:hypothetical protein
VFALQRRKNSNNNTAKRYPNGIVSFANDKENTKGVCDIGCGHDIFSFKKYMIIKDVLKSASLVFFIVCICLISWPIFTGNFGGIYHNSQYPDIWPARGIAPTNSVDVTMPEQNILITGDLGKLVSLNQLDSFNQRKYSVVFSDESTNHMLYNLTAINKIITDDSGQNLMVHFLSEDSIVVKPFENTKSHKPSQVWSKAGTNDPTYAPFHKYLDLFGITNSDLDYGLGLVFTSAKDKLNIPMEIPEAGEYDLYVRYMENEEGGTMKIYLGDTPIDIINSKDKQSDKFIWKKVGKMDLEQGKHTISLENVDGLNAVNVLVFIPSDKIPNILNSTYTTVNKSRNIEILEAESDFLTLGRQNGDKIVFNDLSGTSNRTFIGQFEVPENATQMSLELLGKQNPTSPSSYKIKSFEITPISDTINKIIVTADFEPLPGRIRYYSTDSIYLFLTSQTQNPIAGSQSIRVEIPPAETDIWNGVSTDYLPVSSYGNLTYELSVSAENVNSLHSKMIYYDKNKLPITSSMIFFKQKDGNFSDTSLRSESIPEGTNYIRHQFVVKTNPDMPSYFLFDDVKITQVYSDKPLKNDFSIFGNSYVENDHDVLIHESDIQVNIKKGNETDPIILKSSPIDVGESVSYKYKFDIETSNTNSVSSRIDYSVEDVEKSSRYGVQDGVLILSPNSQISTNMDILKTSNYTVAARVKTCDECSSMVIKVGDTMNKELSLQNNKTEFRWLYLTTPLESGNTDLTIYSNGETELDKLVVYSGAKEDSIETLFSQVNVPSSAVKLNHKKINPMKYEIEIDSPSPFILRFIEPYNPMWTTTFDGKEYHPIPVYFENTPVWAQNMVSTNYPAINGFIINGTGKMFMTIEYKTIEWLYLGAAISSIALILSLSYLILQRKKIVSSAMLFNYITRISSIHPIRFISRKKNE